MEKRGGETKILKNGCNQGQGVGALKKGGLEPSYNLMTNLNYNWEYGLVHETKNQTMHWWKNYHF